MISKKDFYNSIVKVVDETTVRAKKVDAEISVLMADKKSGKYSAAHIRDKIEPRIKVLERELRSITDEGRAKAAEIATGYASELEALDRVRGDALTDDAKLFSIGVTLAKEEVEALIERNADNVTMHKLALRYAKEHDIKLEPRYLAPGHSAEIENAKATAKITDSVIRNYNSDFTREMLMGDKSGFSRAYKSE